jgi:hypothetical protein
MKEGRNPIIGYFFHLSLAREKILAPLSLFSQKSFFFVYFFKNKMINIILTGFLTEPGGKRGT